MIRATWALGQLKEAETALTLLMPTLTKSSQADRVVWALNAISRVADLLKDEQAAYSAEANDALYGE